MQYASEAKQQSAVVGISSTKQAAAILVLCALVQGFFFLTAYYCIPGGSLEFVLLGKAILALIQGNHIGLPPTVAARSVGFPLVLIGSGFFANGSLIGMTIIQGLMAMIMPVLIYWTIVPISRVGAFLISIGSIISLGPFLFVKWLHHDQTYIFFSVVTLWTFSRFVTTRRASDLFWLTAAVVATSFARPAGGLIFPMSIVLAYLIVRGPAWRYAGAICLFAGLAGLNSYVRHQIFYYDGAKPNEYVGGQIFYNLYMNSVEFGIHLSGNEGPAMAEVTDRIYHVMLPSPSASEFLSKFTNAAAPPSEFHDKVIIPFNEKYYYPYSAEDFRTQLYRVPNWEYYFLIFSVVPDSVLLEASWEIVAAHPSLPVLYTARNLWYFLYDPGWFHTRYNPVPIFQGGLFFPPDGQAAIGGSLSAEAAIHRLPSLATKELAFDNFTSQPRWIQSLYRGIRWLWLTTYGAVERTLFYLILVSWIALILSWSATLFGSAKVKEWSDTVGANQLAPHILYVSAYLLYNSLLTAAFVDPDYRYNDMTLLIKIVLAGMGAVVLGRALFSFASRIYPSVQNYKFNAVSAEYESLVVTGGVELAMPIAVAIAVIVCVSWASYTMTHAW